MLTQPLKITPLIGSLMFLLCGCSRSASDAPPKAQLEAQLREAFPKAELVSLTTEARPAPEQVVEITCKARMKVREELFRVIPAPGGGRLFVDGGPEPFVAECLRRGLIVSDEEHRKQPAPRQERNLRLEHEPKLRDTVILERTQTKGEEFEVYGSFFAKRIVDRWEVSPFELAGKGAPAFGQPRGEFGPQAFVQGSADLERQYELVAALKKEREKRLDQRNAALLAFLATDRSLCATYVIDDRGK